MKRENKMLIEQLSIFTTFCGEDERDLIETMVLSAADYISADANMKVKVLNYAGRTGDELREAAEQSDRDRRNAHNVLISYVNIINRICVLHDQTPIYTGPADDRRSYCKFTIQLVEEIFARR